MKNEKVYLLWVKHFQGANPMLIAIYNSELLAEKEKTKYIDLHEPYATNIESTSVFKNSVV